MSAPAFTPRTAHVHRKTRETDVSVRLTLDGDGRYTNNTGVGFLDHMLDLFAKHGGFDLAVTCEGDLHIDDHHTVEDVGITLGQALAEAVGDKAHIARYGHAYVPMDETLARAVIDLSGRFYLHFDAAFARPSVGVQALTHERYDCLGAGSAVERPFLIDEVVEHVNHDQCRFIHVNPPFRDLGLSAR